MPCFLVFSLPHPQSLYTCCIYSSTTIIFILIPMPLSFCFFPSFPSLPPSLLLFPLSLSSNLQFYLPSSHHEPHKHTLLHSHVEVVATGQSTGRVHLLPADGTDLVTHEHLLPGYLDVHTLQRPTHDHVVTMTL